MASTARIARIVIVATGILALSVTAAQARPIGVGYTGQSAANVSNVYQGFYGGQALYQHDAAAKIYQHEAAAKASSVMSPAGRSRQRTAGSDRRHAGRAAAHQRRRLGIQLDGRHARGRHRHPGAATGSDHRKPH